MKRRDFLMTATAVAVSPMAVLAGGKTIEYDRSNPIKAALEDGKTVFVDYAASWCSTCARQERVIGSLRASNPAYDANIVFVRVDWDAFKNDPITRSLNIPRRSTLVALKGDAELGRIVAGTSERDIKRLMDTALAAAQSS